VDDWLHTVIDSGYIRNGHSVEFDASDASCQEQKDVVFREDKKLVAASTQLMAIKRGHRRLQVQSPTNCKRTITIKTRSPPRISWLISGRLAVWLSWNP